MNEPLVITRDLRKIFQKRGSAPIEVLKKVDFEIRQSDRVAIVGKSGAGKSTLLHLLGTLEEPTSGTVHFLGQNIFGFNEQKLSRFRNHSLGFVFQFHYLMLEFTALENAMMPALLAGESKKEAKKRAGQLLDRVGLTDRLDHKPSQLSGGEQQRVAIARALMNNPKLLLTDEMTGNLDPATGQQIFDLLHEIHEEFQMALVSVTHDEAMAATYHRVFRLRDGVLLPEM